MLSRLDTSSRDHTTVATFAIARRDPDEHRSVIEIDGELDLASAPELKWALIDALEAGHTGLVVDLSRTSFMDSTALGVLVGFNRSLDAHARLSIVCSDDAVSKIFELSGMDGVFAIFPTLEQALSHVRVRSAEVG
ncbi:MAG TPA: STAS domain-containing protein [Solirubrobacteraceae bacterium]|nr:STAS domain-containing protein [Solirubrobacteraceae bacterium]